MLGHQCLELPDQLVVTPEREISVEPELDRYQPDLLEPGDRRLGEALIGEIRQRWTSPEREGVAEPLRRVGRQAASEQAPSLVHEALEAVEIERIRLDPDDVAGRSGRQHVPRKRLAQSRDVDPQRGGGVLGRVVAPELVDQPVGGNDLVRDGGGARTRSARGLGPPRETSLPWSHTSSGPRIRNSI